jgi:hypothetical protein
MNEETAPAAAAAAEIARAMSECMNLLFLFAAPRVMKSVGSSNLGGLDEPTVLASLRRFLKQASGIRARATAEAEDLDRLVRAAILVEEIAGELGAHHAAQGASLPSPLPPTVVARAQQALGILGMPAPEGGWDAFEGFSVPLPPAAR